MDNHLYGLNSMSDVLGKYFLKKCTSIFGRMIENKEIKQSNWGNWRHICKQASFLNSQNSNHHQKIRVNCKRS